MREFAVDISIGGIYDESLYELDTVEEALAEWALLYPDEYKEEFPQTIEVESVHVDDVNDWRIS